jgi:hypothetical protein
MNHACMNTLANTYTSHHRSRILLFYELPRVVPSLFLHASIPTASDTIRAFYFFRSFCVFVRFACFDFLLVFDVLFFDPSFCC